MKFEIKCRFTAKVLFETEADSLKLAVEAAVKAGADLAGADLADANLVGADLVGANLADANLVGANLAGADLADANLAGADLADANLARADLADANLARANLDGKKITGPALLKLFDFETIPLVEGLDGKVADACSIEGALDMTRWHTCETTHCRAGWAITLAGEYGRLLERRQGSWLAGALIYAKSTGRDELPDFYASDTAAMADILKCAGGAA